MPLEVGLWRIDSKLQRVNFTPLDQESRLQELLDQDISIASPDWMVIGREVPTAWRQRIDLLAIDGEGNLIVIELKRDRTPREVVAQVLEYGSWVQTLRTDDIARIFNQYVDRFQPQWGDISIDRKFQEWFNKPEMPDELNQSHQLVVVSAVLDPGSERIVEYLSKTHAVDINVIFFRVFKDEDREYLSRVWLIDPTLLEVESSKRATIKSGQWNGEHYVSFAESTHRRWADAKKFGFVSAGGGSRYINSLGKLEPGNRIWVNIPGTGYVGVGEVTSGMVHFKDFLAAKQGNHSIPLLDLGTELEASDIFDESHSEHFVGVKWIKTVGVGKAIKEKGFFGNQNIVASPKSDKWEYTIQRLRKQFDVPDLESDDAS